MPKQLSSLIRPLRLCKRRSVSVIACTVVLGVAAVTSGCQAVQFEAAAASLNLPRIPWEGGPAYYKQFVKADAAGWDEPTFFPISVFLGSADPSHVDQLRDAGVNTYLAVQHAPHIHPISNITSRGLFAIANLDPENRTSDWTSVEVGDDRGVVGWFATDECEMGYSGCTKHKLTATECDNAYDKKNAALTKLYVDRAECKSIASKITAVCSPLDPAKYQNLDECLEFVYQKHLADQLRTKADGRFVAANFGSGIARTFWSPTAMDSHYQYLDFTAVDKYAYTSKGAAGVFTGGGYNSGSFDWPEDAIVNRAATYGFMADQFKRLQDPNNYRPIGVMVETGQPLIARDDCWTPACNIKPEQIEGAVWSAIIHEARHISYFSFNNGPTCGEIVNCPVVHDKVKVINGKIRSLAPVLNGQSYYNETYANNGTTFYRYSFHNGTDTMLKTHNGSAYIFAGLGMDVTGQNTANCWVIDGKRACKNRGTSHPPGSKTFTLPAGVGGTTVEVVGENRTIPVINGSFTDNFAAEYIHHVYKITL